MVVENIVIENAPAALPALWMWAVGLIGASFLGKAGERLFEATFIKLKDQIVSNNNKGIVAIDYGIPAILKAMYFLALFGIISSIAFGTAGATDIKSIQLWCYVIGNSANLISNIFVVFVIANYFKVISTNNA